VYPKVIGDGVRSPSELVGTLLAPPLFWLDDIFKIIRPSMVAEKAGFYATGVADALTKTAVSIKKN
jgi:hypothetical protein